MKPAQSHEQGISQFLRLLPRGWGRKATPAASTVLLCAILAGAILCLAWSLFSSVVSTSFPSWLAVFVAIFIAAVISSTVGFAFSAIAAAMILHLVPDNVAAVQIMMAASIGIQAYSVAELHRSISWPTCIPFLIGGAATVPAGVYLLLSVHSQAYIFWMGVALVLYGTFTLVMRPISIARGGVVMNGLVGALGGLTGPLAAFPGAFVTIWCGMRGWDKVAQRSVYQPYILLIQILTLILMIYALPGILGAYLGLRVFRHLTDAQFQRVVNIALIVSGVALALK